MPILKHTTIIAVIILFMTGCIFLPFLPGDYDALAIPLSAMVQLLAISGLLFVPVGLLWMIMEIRRNKKPPANSPHSNKGFSTAALMVSCLVALVGSLGAFATQSLSMCLIVLLFSSCLILITARKLKRYKKDSANSIHPAPFYLIFIPVLVVLIRFIWVGQALEFSRNQVIRNSAPLISDIEAYYSRNGNYPLSLLSLWEDYKPSIRGIQRYYYERNDSAYNLYFQQFNSDFSIKEIVMYNKLDKQDFSSHNSDLLTLGPADINVQRGYFAVHEADFPHWKYFWFD